MYNSKKKNTKSMKGMVSLVVRFFLPLSIINLWYNYLKATHTHTLLQQSFFLSFCNKEAILTAEAGILTFLFNLKFSLYRKNLYNCPYLKDKIIAASLRQNICIFDQSHPPKKKKVLYLKHNCILPHLKKQHS